MTAGGFITLEGGEGAGKTTQSELLGQALMARGHSVLRTREPGGSPGAERLRGLLLGGDYAWAARAETLLHFAARADHVAKTIQPALDAGQWVICDRFYDSTVAYQGHGLGADLAFIDAQIRLLDVHPALTLILDVPDAVAAERMLLRHADADRYERMDAAFHARVRKGFQSIAAADPRRCVVLDASAGIAAVHANILAVVASHFRLPEAAPRASANVS